MKRKLLNNYISKGGLKMQFEFVWLKKKCFIKNISHCLSLIIVNLLGGTWKNDLPSSKQQNWFCIYQQTILGGNFVVKLNRLLDQFIDDNIDTFADI